MPLKKFNKKEYQKKYYLNNKEKRKEYSRKHYLKNKEKRKKQQKIWELKNREERLKQKKEYHLKNKERHSKQMKEHYLKTKERYQERSKKNNSKPETKELTRNRQNNRYHTDINFRILTLCRGRVRLALKGLNKSASTMELIGCTIDELRNHIESKFEPWMTWENQGKGGWDIDHIKACFHFNLADPEQQRACFNWSNLQPMEHIANIKKGVA